MDELKGYKAFHKGLINRYGEQFEVGKTYKVDGQVQFGNQGNGFHFCTNLEDTLRYVPAKEEEVVICEVTLRGKVMIMDDEYNGFYDMGAAQEMTIDRIIPREEIISMYLDKKKNEFSVRRFIQLFGLTEEEIKMFLETYFEFR